MVAHEGARKKGVSLFYVIRLCSSPMKELKNKINFAVWGGIPYYLLTPKSYAFLKVCLKKSALISRKVAC